MTNNIQTERQGLAQAPDPLREISQNAYRVLGLPADASWKLIIDRGATLHRAAKAGIRRPSAWNFEWHGPLRRDEIAISGALGMLGDPRQRLRERLFWIAQSETFVKHIPTQGVDASVASLRGSYSSQSCHDAAVLALISCSSSDPKLINPKGWTEMLGMWIDTVTCEEFWNEFLEAEDAGDFEPTASSEELAELRADCLKLIAEPIAATARDAASRREFDRCGRALEVIRAAKLPVEIVSTIEDEVLGPYEDALSRLSEKIRTWTVAQIKQDRTSGQLNEEPSAIAVSRWVAEFAPEYNNFIAMANADSPAGIRASEDHARLLENLGYARGWANKWADAEDLLNEARKYITSKSPAWERIQAKFRSFAKSAAIQRAELAPEAEQKSHESYLFEPAEDQTTGNREGTISHAELDQVCESDSGARQAAYNLAGFCDLCSSIEAKCRGPFAAGQTNPKSPHVALLVAWNEYESNVTPWLNVILAKYIDQVAVLGPVKNAAATCLHSLASALLLARDLENAYALGIEALSLVFENDRLKAAIQDCLDRVASERQRSQENVNGVEPPSRAKEKSASTGTIKAKAGNKHGLSEGKPPLRIRRLTMTVIATILICPPIVALMIAMGTAMVPQVAGPEHHLTPQSANSELGPPEQPAAPISEGSEVVKASHSPSRLSGRRATPGYQALAETAELKASNRPQADPFLAKIIELTPSTESLHTRLSSEHHQPMSLPNGTDLIERADVAGRGRLTISNHSPDDAVVKLKSKIDGKTMRFVYIRAMSDLDLAGISPGEYLLQFSSGQDWETTTSAFRENQSFAQFGRPLVFSEERREGNYIFYSEHKVTLHTVPNGNVTKTKITPAEFNR